MLFSLQARATDDFTIIVNAQVSEQQLPRNQARGIFSMRLHRWSDGKPIVVFVLPDQSSEHRVFVQKILAMFPHQLRRQWDRFVYTGTGQAPIEVKSEEEMLERVRNTPGAIGYIRRHHRDEEDAEEPVDDTIRQLQVY